MSPALDLRQPYQQHQGGAEQQLYMTQSQVHHRVSSPIIVVRRLQNQVGDPYDPNHDKGLYYESDMSWGNGGWILLFGLIAAILVFTIGTYKLIKSHKKRKKICNQPTPTGNINAVPPPPYFGAKPNTDNKISTESVVVPNPAGATGLTGPMGPTTIPTGIIGKFPPSHNPGAVPVSQIAMVPPPQPNHGNGTAAPPSNPGVYPYPPQAYASGPQYYSGISQAFPYQAARPLGINHVQGAPLGPAAFCPPGHPAHYQAAGMVGPGHPGQVGIYGGAPLVAIHATTAAPGATPVPPIKKAGSYEDSDENLTRVNTPPTQPHNHNHHETGVKPDPNHSPFREMLEEEKRRNDDLRDQNKWLMQVIAHKA